MEPDRRGDTDAAADRMTAPAEDFLAHRSMLYGLAYRLLGSWHDAEDVVQEAYLRWSGADRSLVDQPRRYLTRVVARLAIDHLRVRRARRETYVGEWLPEPVATDPSPFGAVDTSDLSLAMLHLMERLAPPQRAVYVLRTAFEMPFDEIAPIVDRTPDDCRQLYHRAGQALRTGRPRFAPDAAEYRRLLTDFLAAARDGDLARLEGLLHTDVVAYSDGGGKVRAARNPIVTPAKVARFFVGVYARSLPPSVVPVELNGLPAVLVHAPDSGTTALAIDVRNGVICGIYVILNPDKLAGAGTHGCAMRRDG